MPSMLCRAAHAVTIGIIDAFSALLPSSKRPICRGNPLRSTRSPTRTGGPGLGLGWQLDP